MKMAQLMKAGILCVLISGTVIAETTDNLLINGNFSDSLNDWTVEDSSKIKHDNNCYAGGTDASGLCKSVRWSSDLGKTISQTINNLESGYDITGINVSFTALGCNNEANSSTWCTQGTDYDKVQTTIQLYDGSKTETLYLEQILDYNDGTQNYDLSTQTLDTWTTDNLNIDFSITGIDTGNWSGWYAPIVDNINLSMDITETVIPEPVIQSQSIITEPIEEIEVIETVENSIISSIDLETSVLNDVILEIPEIPELPEIEIIEVAVVDEIPEINESIEIQETPEIDVPVINTVEELTVVEDIEVIEEVAEIEEITEIEDITEQENTEDTKEESEQLVETTVDEDLAESNEKKPEESKSKKDSKKQQKQQNVTKIKPKIEKNKPKNVEIPVVYTLLTIQEPIKIIETVKLVEVISYEQDITDYTSNDAWDNLNNSTNDRWLNLDSLKPLFSFRGYRKDSSK